MNCPGSVALSRDIPGTTSKYAEEGTAAHQLAELALQRDKPTSLWVSTELHRVFVTEEMCEAVQVFVDHVVSHRTPGSILLVEQQFNLSPLNPPTPMFGTGDAVTYDPSSRTLYVDDLKYGQGTVVEVEGNVQLQYYGLGAVLEFERTHPEYRGQVLDVVLTIVQPRASHPDGLVRSWKVSYLDLVAFAEELMEAARRALEPDAPVLPGSWCKFCRAAGVCPALKEQATSVALVEFEAMPASLPPDPKTLPTEVLVDVLNNADLLEDWLKAVRGHVMSMLERGEAVPGYKLVDKRATRRWKNEKLTLEFLENLGYTRARVSDTKLKSPAQVEKLLKGDKVPLPADLVSKKSSGVTLAPTSDSRAEVVSDPASEFAADPPAQLPKPRKRGESKTRKEKK
jgi:hypothetical protein